MGKAWLKRHQAWIKAAISVLLLAYIATIIDWRLFGESIRNVRTGYALLVLLFIPINLIIRAYRYKLIVNECVDDKRITILDSLRLYVIGYALNLVMPGSSGDLARSYYGYKRHGIKEELVSSGFLDLTFGFFALFIFGLYYSLAFGYLEYALLSAVIIAVSGAVIFFPRLMPWKWLEGIAGRFKMKLSKEKLLKGTLISMRLKIWGIIVSLFGWWLTFVQYYFITNMYGIDMTLAMVSAIVPLVLLSRVVPIAINGLGTQEAVTAGLFALAGVSATLAVLTSLTMTVVFMVIPGLFGLYWILKTKY